MTGTTNSKKRSIYRNVRGITLVELIVVLIILVILASAGIGAATAYAKRAVIEQNQSNAETIYQAAQTALQQMQKAGGVFSPSANKVLEVNTWVNNLMSKGSAYQFVESNMSDDMKENRSIAEIRLKEFL